MSALGGLKKAAMIISFHPCFDSGYQIILGDRPIDSDILSRIKKAEVIILPQWCTEELFRACLQTGALLFPDYRKRFEYAGKTGQSRLFSNLGLPHPETLCWENVSSFEKKHGNLEKPPHKWPFVLKEDGSHEAEGVHLADSPEALRISLERIALREKSGPGGFVTQEFIDGSGNILRSVIIGEDVISYWKRPSTPGQIITTISRGAIIDHGWRPDMMEKGRKLALELVKMTGINLAAVDFIPRDSEEDYTLLFLEINYYFGRRGLGGSEKFYKLLFNALQSWLEQKGFDHRSIKLV